MMISVLMMCAGSLMIAVLPTYAAIGAAAPVLLLLARLVQGLSVGGEYGTSATYMSEVAIAGQSRLLRIVPIRHADRRAAAGAAACWSSCSSSLRRRAAAGLGLARSVPVGAHCRGRRAVPAPLAG